jgi:hypothetical protein
MLALQQITVGQIVVFTPPFEHARQFGQIAKDYGNIEDGDHYVAVRAQDGRKIDMVVDELESFSGTIGYDWFDERLIPASQQPQVSQADVPYPTL